MKKIFLSLFQDKLKSLKILFFYLTPYRFQMMLAFISLACAAITILLIGLGLRHLIDEGFAHQNFDLMNQAMLSLTLCSLVLAGAGADGRRRRNSIVHTSGRVRRRSHNHAEASRAVLCADLNATQASSEVRGKTLLHLIFRAVG